MISDNLSFGRVPRDVDNPLRHKSVEWTLIIGLLAIMVPTLVRLGQQNWSTEAGAHGPIVLATGIWLLWNNVDLSPRRPGSIWLTLLNPVLLLGALATYIFGRAYDLLILEVGGVYAVGLILSALTIGWRAMASNLFPFTYMAFLIPIPGWVLAYLTAPLQQLVSSASTSALQLLDYPVFREGVVITVAQYQLLVEDACAGMNSLMGLISVSMFYIYILHRASWRHSGALLLCIIPIAIIVNIIRVITLILLTYHFGDAVAQGFMHITAGMVLFGLALSLMVLADNILRALSRRASVGRL